MSPDHLDVIKNLRKRDSAEEDEPISSSNGHKKEDAVQVKSLILDDTTNSLASSIKIDEYLKNAYRILGLSAKASQAEIHEANSSIRRTLKIGIDKSTTWDLPWLGPLTRTEKDLQAAIGRLTNPAQRLQERLFWLSDNAALLNEASIESLPTVISELEEKANDHDLALLKLAYANLIDPELKNKSLWVETINLWQNVIDLDDYWASLLDLEMDGEFEPFATIEEVESLKLNTNKLVCSRLLALANEGVVSKNDAICGQVFSILRDSKLPRNTFYEFEAQVLGGLEDEFVQLCEQIRKDSSNALNKEDTNAPDNIKACTTALNRFNNEIQPFLNRLLNLSGQNAELANRIKEEAATCLRDIAIDFIWADEFIRSQELLERARTIAPKDSSIYHRILEDLGDVEKISEKQRIWKHLQRGISLFLNLVSFLMISLLAFSLISDSSSTNSSNYSPNYSSGYSSTPSETTDYSSAPSETYTDSNSTSTNESATQDVQTPPEGVIPSNQFGSIYKDELKAKIEAGRAKLTSLEASYNQLADEVQNMKLELNQKQAELATLEAQATDDASIEEYETKRQAYNQLVERYNQTLSRAKKAEQEYNTVLEEDHKMVQEYNSL